MIQHIALGEKTDAKLQQMDERMQRNTPENKEAAKKMQKEIEVALRGGGVSSVASSDGSTATTRPDSSVNHHPSAARQGFGRK